MILTIKRVRGENMERDFDIEQERGYEQVQVFVTKNV